MEVIIHESPAEVAARSADIVSELVIRKPDAVLGLATGSTPVALYEELVRRHKDGLVSFHRSSTFNLDEYVGLPPSHSQSYRSFMNRTLFNQVDINLKNTHVPAGDSKNPVAEAQAYDQRIADAGGIDLQILGIGSDGHIAFNEPTSSLGSRTRIKTLTERTMTDNARFFGPDETPPHLAITMGIGTIMEADRIVLLATGKNKARAIADMIEGPVAAICPASILQFHQKTSIIIDRDAASELKLINYYRWVLTQQDQIAEKYGDHRA